MLSLFDRPNAFVRVFAVVASFVLCQDLGVRIDSTLNDHFQSGNLLTLSAFRVPVRYFKEFGEVDSRCASIGIVVPWSQTLLDDPGDRNVKISSDSVVNYWPGFVAG